MSKRKTNGSSKPSVQSDPPALTNNGGSDPATSPSAGDNVVPFDPIDNKWTTALFAVVYKFFEELKLDPSIDPELKTADLLRQLKGAVPDKVYHVKIRNAIDELTTLGHLIRRSAHGLTIPVSSYYRTQYLDNRELKEAIAKVLVKHIEPGTSLACTDGTTVAHCVEVMLQKRRHVAIVTNSMSIAELAIEDSDIQLTGGTYLSSTHSCTGETACKSFREYPCRSALLGVSGIGDKGELYVYHPPDCKIRDAAINAATDSIIVVADATKLGKRDRWHFGTLGTLLESHEVTLITNHPSKLAVGDQERADEILKKLRNIKGRVRPEDRAYMDSRKLKLIEAGTPPSEKRRGSSRTGTEPPESG